MTFEELFERLTEHYGLCKNAIAVLHYRELEVGIYLNKNFEFLHGLINGLHTVEILTDDEFNDLYDILKKLVGDEE